jgi:hypothetical protein
MTLSIILAIAGFSLILWRRKLALVMYRKLQLPWSKIFPGLFQKVLGDTANWENSWLVKVNRWGLTFAGIVLLLGAYVTYFGPITL